MEQKKWNGTVVGGLLVYEVDGDVSSVVPCTRDHNAEMIAFVDLGFNSGPVVVLCPVPCKLSHRRK